MNCTHCKGECCHLDRREGTTRYAQLVPHGQGIHWCRHCQDGEVLPPDPRDELIAKLREVIAHWPRSPHQHDCKMLKPVGVFYLETRCTCGAAQVDAARAEARKLAGLELLPSEKLLPSADSNSGGDATATIREDT